MYKHFKFQNKKNVFNCLTLFIYRWNLRSAIKDLNENEKSMKQKVRMQNILGKINKVIKLIK